MLRRRVVLAVLLLPGISAASAETVLTPFAGVAFGGGAEGSHGTYGGSLAFFGGAAGFELEFAITPHYFGAGVSNALLTENDVVTGMGSLLIIVPSGPVRPYAAAGAGLLKTRLEDAAGIFHVDSTDFGFNVGGGLIFYIGHTVGLRGDVRYFRSFSDLNGAAGPNLDLGTVAYWRAVGGISFKF